MRYGHVFSLRTYTRRVRSGKPIHCHKCEKLLVIGEKVVTINHSSSSIAHKMCYEQGMVVSVGSKKSQTDSVSLAIVEEVIC